MKIAIIGAGVIGLNIAWDLRSAGADVEVLEAGTVGDSASAVNAGWVTPSLSTPLASPGIVGQGIRHMFDRDGALVFRPQPDTQWMKWLWNFSRAARPKVYERGVKALLGLNRQTMDLFDELEDDGVQFEMRRAGILALALQPGGLGWFRQLFDELVPLGFTGGIDYLSPAEAHALDPAAGAHVAEAARTTLDRFVDPDGLIQGLLARVTDMGVAVHQNRPVQAMRKNGHGWVISTPSGELSADQVIVALGAATNKVLSSVGVSLPIIGARGYSVELTGRGTPPKHAFYLMESKLGLSPFERGVRIAGVFELPGGEGPVPQRRLDQLLEQTKPYLGDWTPDAATVTKGRGGLRPATPDSLPFIGPVPDHEGLFVAAGHGMLGVTLAPATARAMRSMVMDRSIPEHALPFQLAGRV
jgi:D-amino-acid dehydrogenase